VKWMRASDLLQKCDMLQFIGRYSLVDQILIS
jgi:hypothetical protein